MKMNYLPRNIAIVLISFILIIALSAGCSFRQIYNPSHTENYENAGNTGEQKNGVITVFVETNKSSRYALPSNFKDEKNQDLAFMVAVTPSETPSASDLQTATYTYDAATNKNAISFSFMPSESPRENYTLNIYTFPHNTNSVSSLDSAILHGSTKITIEADATSKTLTVPVVMYPLSGVSQKGFVNLKIKVPKSFYLSCSSSDFSLTRADDSTATNGLISYSVENSNSGGIENGSHTVTFSLKNSDSSSAPAVYAWTETIIVLPSLTTNIWKTGDVDSDGARKIPEVTIYSTFYVCGTPESGQHQDSWFADFDAAGGVEVKGDDDSGDGSIAKPYASVQKAIDRIVGTGSSTGINDGETSYTIFVDGLIKASSDGTVANFSSVGSGAVKISIIGLGAASNKATLKGNYSAVGSKDSVIVIPENSSLNLTLDNLIITEGAASNGGGIYIGSGTVTIKDCEISGNRVINCGGAIYNEGTLNFAGAVKVGEDNDVYLSSDGAGGVKFITITSALSASGTVARITLPSENYKAGTQVLAVDGITMTDSICQKIKLNKFDDTTAESTAFFIVAEGTTKGVLKSNQSSATNPVELQGAYTLTVKKNSSNLNAGAVISTGDILSFTVTDSKGNAPNASNYKIAVKQHGEEITVLTKSVTNISDAKITIPRTLVETGDTIDVFVSATINGVTYDNTVRGIKLVLTP